MTIPLSYFAIGFGMDTLTNVETVLTTCPQIIPDQGGLPMSVQGSVVQRAANGYARRNGTLVGRWRFDVFDTYADYRTLKTYLNRANSVYIITFDEDGHWSPYLCYLDTPFIGASLNVSNEIPHSVVINQFGAVLQYDSYQANHTVTIDEHLILSWSQTAAFTLTLPAISTVPTYVPYRFVNAGAFDVTLDGDGSETIDGSTTKVLAGANLLTDGNMEAADATAYTSENSAVLSKETGTPHGGTNVLRVARNGSTLSYATQAALEIGIRYTIHGYVRSDGNATPVVYVNDTSQYTLTTSTSWQEFNFDVTAYDTDVKFGLSAGTDTWYVEFDDITVTHNLPEPYGFQAETQCTLISNGSQWITIADA